MLLGWPRSARGQPNPVSPGGATPPGITVQPLSTTAVKDTRVSFSVVGHGAPLPVQLWCKDGAIVAGQSRATLALDRVQPIDAGAYTVLLGHASRAISSSPATITVTADLTTKSGARWWNEALLDGIR